MERLALVALVLGCGGGAVSTAPPRVVASTAPPAAAAPIAPRLALHLAPPMGRYRAVDDQHWFSGSVRARGEGDGMQIAEHAFSVDISEALLAGSDYVFFLSNGEIWRSPAFLEEPSYVGSISRARTPVAHEGRVYLVTATGSLLQIGPGTEAEPVPGLEDYVLKNIAVSSGTLYVQEAGELWLRRVGERWERCDAPAPAAPPSAPAAEHEVRTRIFDLLERRLPMGLSAGLTMGLSGHLIGRGVRVSAESTQTFPDSPPRSATGSFRLLDTGRGYLAIGVDQDPDAETEVFVLEGEQAEWELLTGVSGRRLRSRGFSSIDGSTVLWTCGESELCFYDLESRVVSFVDDVSFPGQLVHHGSYAYYRAYGTPGVLRMSLEDGSRSLVDVPDPPSGSRLQLIATPDGFYAQTHSNESPGAAYRFDGTNVQELELPATCTLMAPVGAPWVLCANGESLHASHDGSHWFPIAVPPNATLETRRFFFGQPCRYAACAIGDLVVTGDHQLPDQGGFTMLTAQSPRSIERTPWEIPGLQCLNTPRTASVTARAVALDGRMHFRAPGQSIRWNAPLPAGDVPWESELAFQVHAITPRVALFGLRIQSMRNINLPRTHLAHRSGIAPIEVYSPWWRAEPNGDLSLLDMRGYRRIDRRGQSHEDLGEHVTALVLHDGSLLKAVPAGDLRWAVVGPGDARRVVQLERSAFALCSGEADEGVDQLVARDIHGFARTIVFELGDTPCVRESVSDVRLHVRNSEWYFADGTKCEVTTP